MNEEAPSIEQKYTAPALEKGLDIIEFPAASAVPRTVFEISEGFPQNITSKNDRILNISTPKSPTTC